MFDFIIESVKGKKKSQLKAIMQEGFHDYLVQRFALSKQNLEFWKLWVTGVSQQELASELFISINAIKSRRLSLRKKINQVHPISENFDQALAIIIYNKEFDLFQNLSE